MPGAATTTQSEFDFIRDIERSAIEQFNRENPYDQSFSNDVAGFVAAVNWTGDGHWLAVFAVIHAVYLALVVCFRRAEVVQAGVFVTICGLVFALEYINAFLHYHWREFSTQDYFDRHGTFLGVMLAGPLMLIGFLQVR